MPTQRPPGASTRPPMTPPGASTNTALRCCAMSTAALVTLAWAQIAAGTSISLTRLPPPLTAFVPPLVASVASVALVLVVVWASSRQASVGEKRVRACIRSTAAMASYRHLAMSSSPTTVPASSSTGRWRKRCAIIVTTASTALSAVATQRGPAVMASRTNIASGARPSATSLVATSLLVRMPSSVPSARSTRPASALATDSCCTAAAMVDPADSRTPGRGRRSSTVRLDGDAGSGTAAANGGAVAVGGRPLEATRPQPSLSERCASRRAALSWSLSQRLRQLLRSELATLSVRRRASRTTKVAGVKERDAFHARRRS
eukprot:scaffold56226_cov66-Phaeocystis_antarctica.AAC.7